MNDELVKEITSIKNISENKLMENFANVTKKRDFNDNLIPMETIHIKKNENDIAPVLMIMLPPFDSTSEDFINKGFVKTIKESNFDADILLANAHFGYYKNRCLEDRLYEDVILKAKDCRYQNIWLIGISMGGVGALTYLRKYSETIDGVFLISPFLAQPEIYDEIKNAGGLRKWEPKEEIEEEEKLRAVWYWLKKYFVNRDKLPRLALGFGKDDIFADSYHLLSEILEKENLFIIDGHHDWKTWHDLFSRFLQCNKWRSRDISHHESMI